MNIHIYVWIAASEFGSAEIGNINFTDIYRVRSETMKSSQTRKGFTHRT